MSKLREKGITLVALVVTVIILLILAGVTIAQISGNNGLFSRVKQAVGQYKNASLDEESTLKEIDKHLSEFEVLGGDKTDEGVKVKITNFEANQEGKNIKAVVTVEGTASKIEYSLDGEVWENNKDNEKNAEYTFEDTEDRKIKIGSYNVRVRVYDEEGKKTEAMSLVTIVDTDINIANDEEVLKGKKYYDGERELHAGIMPDHAGDDIEVAGEETPIPKGYYNGEGKIISAYSNHLILAGLTGIGRNASLTSSFDDSNRFESNLDREWFIDNNWLKPYSNTSQAIFKVSYSGEYSINWLRYPRSYDEYYFSKSIIY